MCIATSLPVAHWLPRFVGSRRLRSNTRHGHRCERDLSFLYVRGVPAAHQPKRGHMAAVRGAEERSSETELLLILTTVASCIIGKRTLSVANLS